MFVWLQQGYGEFLSPVLTRGQRAARKSESHPVQNAVVPGQHPTTRVIFLSIKLLIKNFAELDYISFPLFCRMLLFNLWGHRTHYLVCWQ